MRLLAIADLHNRHDMLVQILSRAGRVDAVLFGGDITNFGTPADAMVLIETAQDHAPLVLAVAGNCDSQRIDDAICEMGVGLDGRGRVHGEVGFLGVSAIPPWGGRMYSREEDELAALLADGEPAVAAARARVLLTHVPPRGTAADRAMLGQHAGSLAVREFIDRTQPTLAICGHIHEARGQSRLGATTVVNCGAAKAGYYAIIEINLPAAGKPSTRVELGKV